MDSINLSALQSTPLNCRNTASNTSPIACACCGSKDYVQTVPQTNYFRILYPGISRCKHSQDNCEDNCVIPPFYPSVPLVQPFFHNCSMPGNVYFTHNHFDDGATCLNQAPEQNQAEDEKRRNHLGDYDSFDQKEKRDFKGSKSSIDENTQKSFAPPGAESQLSDNQSFISNLMDPQFNPFIQRCSCGDSTPRTCSPFIVPIVSYCLLWNSQNYNNTLPGNCPDNQPDILLQQHKEVPSNLRYSTSNGNEVRTGKNLDINASTSADDKNYSSEDSLGNGTLSDNKLETNAKSSVNSFLLTTHSLNLTEDNTFNNTEKKNQITYSTNYSQDIRSEKVETTEGFVTGIKVESYESLKTYEKAPCGSKEQLLISLDYIKDNKNVSQEALLTKADDNSKNCTELMKASGGELPSLKRSYWKIQDSGEEYKKITPENKATITKEQMSFKKFINNFTITEQSGGGLSDREHISAPAGGDLGGENCVGYKVHISPSKGDQQEKIRQETQTETNSGTKETLLKDLGDLKERKPESFFETNAKASTKNSRFKSNIAKPSSGIKARDTKELYTKNENKESSKEETYVVKRKHSCFPSDSATGHLKNSSKIQKTRNCLASQQKNQGSVKLQRTLSNRSQFYKKEEKAPIFNVRHQGFQEQSNAAVKNWRK